jgi:hypothetical protein
MLIQTIGVSAMTGLQSPEPVPGGSSDDVFFATRQVWLLASFKRAVHVHPREAVSYPRG